MRFVASAHAGRAALQPASFNAQDARNLESHPTFENKLERCRITLTNHADVCRIPQIFLNGRARIINLRRTMGTRGDTQADGCDPAPVSDRVFLADLNQRFRPALIQYFRKRVRRVEDIDDLVQEVFLRLTRRAQLGDIESVEGYVFHTAANVLRDRARRSAVRHEAAHLSLEETADPGSDISPERVLLGKEAVARLTAGLRQLPERTRDVFVLRALEGRKYAEIARLLGISARAAEKQMVKALAALGRVVDDGT